MLHCQTRNWVKFNGKTVRKTHKKSSFIGKCFRSTMNKWEKLGVLLVFVMEAATLYGRCTVIARVIGAKLVLWTLVCMLCGCVVRLAMATIPTVLESTRWYFLKSCGPANKSSTWSTCVPNPPPPPPQKKLGITSTLNHHLYPLEQIMIYVIWVGGSTCVRLRYEGQHKIK